MDLFTYFLVMPKEFNTPQYSLKPLVSSLSELLGVEVKIANDCIYEEVKKLVARLPKGGVFFLRM